MQYQKNRSVELRSELMMRHAYIPQRTALKLKKKLPRHVDIDDLVQAGSIGLMQAVEKFNPLAGVTFLNYAIRRVHGAMVDFIRDMDWVPRLVRQRKEVAVGLSSLSAPAPHDGKPKEMGDTLADDKAAAGMDLYESNDAISALLRCLPTRQHRKIVALYHVGGFTMKEVGQQIGLSESRVSQVMSEAMLILRARHVPVRLANNRM